MIRRTPVLGLVLVSTPVMSAGAASNASWASLASAATVSPFVAQSGDTASQWVAPDGRRITLTVRGPHPQKTSVVSVAVPAAGADATPVLAAAIASAQKSGASTISLAAGTYTFKTLDKSQLGHLVISGLQDVTILGNGATFVFMNNAVGLYITQSQRLVVQSLRLSYGFNTASLGTMTSESGRTVLDVTSSQFPITAADGIGALEQFDPVNKVFVPDGIRVYEPTAPALVGANTYSSSSFSASMVGKSFAILHHYYGGVAVEIEDSFLSGAAQDQDITLDNVWVQSGPGMGIVAYGIARGLFILNSSVAPRPGGLFSTEYDAMHLQEIGGDVYIENNTISGQGDDAINAAAPVIPLVSLDQTGTRLTLGVYSRFIQAGDTLAFFDANDDFLGATTVKSIVSTGYPNSSFVLAGAVAGAAGAPVVRDVELTNNRMVIARNVISNCECHAVLLQTPNALVLDNTISETANGGIEALSNIGSFLEGSGAINDTIEGNTLSSTGSDPSLAGMTWGAINLYGATGAGLQTTPINFNLEVLSNVVTNALGTGCITVASSSNVQVAANSCVGTNVGQPLHTPAIEVLDAATVSLSGNTLSGASTGPIAIGSGTTGISQ